jgi:hypothetical protein
MYSISAMLKTIIYKRTRFVYVELRNLLCSLSHWERIRVGAYTIYNSQPLWSPIISPERYLSLVRLDPHPSPLPTGEGTNPVGLLFSAIEQIPSHGNFSIAITRPHLDGFAAHQLICVFRRHSSRNIDVGSTFDGIVFQRI